MLSLFYSGLVMLGTVWYFLVCLAQGGAQWCHCHMFERWVNCVPL